MGCISVSAKCSNLVSVSGIFPNYETTNVEFGYWLHTGKALYGRPDDAKKIKYLDWLYKTDTNKSPY